MPINKNAIIRYNVLDKCFSNPGRKYFFDDLLEEVNTALVYDDPDSTGIQVRQLRSDINFMKSDAGFSAPIKAYRVGKKAYYRYEEPSFSINKSPLNKTEADQLKSALVILQRFEGSPEFEWVNEIGPMLRDQFGLKDDEEKIISYDSNIDYSGYEHIATLFNAIVNKQVLELKYQSFLGAEFDFTFHPYYLKQFNNRWFVFGRHQEREINQWNVPLDRIVAINESSENYVRNTTDWEDYFYDIVGVTRGEGDPEEVELLFSKEQAPYILTKPLHPTQRAKTLDSGELQVRIKVISNFELKKQLLSFGASLEVISPEYLREQIVNEIQGLKQLYLNG